MKIGTNRTERKVYLFWESSFEEVHVRAFAKKHSLPLRVHSGKQCLALDVPGQRLLLHEFLFSTATEALARQVFDDIIRRMNGENRPERTYGMVN